MVFVFDVLVFIQLNKLLLLKLILERVASYFPLAPSQSQLTFFGHERKLCSESSVSIRIIVNAA